MILVHADDFLSTVPRAVGFISDLDSLCVRDYGKCYFNEKIACIDMDAFETSKSGDNDRTMDAAIGIATYQNNKSSDKRFLLVELRFDYISTRNFDYNNMSDKICHTKDILSGNRIHDKYVFVYNDNVAAQANNEFSRKAKVHSEYKRWLSLSPTGFKNMIDRVENQPYTPINDVNSIINSMKASWSKDDNRFLDTYNGWINKIENYKNQYNYQEAESILNALKNAILEIKDSTVGREDYRPIMIDEIERMLNSIKK